MIPQVTKPVDRKPNKSHQPKKLRRRGSDASSPISEPVPVDRGRIAIMPKGSSTSLLPSIILSSKTQYLATLYNALYASEEPFDDFTKSSPEFLKISRWAFEA